MISRRSMVQSCAHGAVCAGRPSAPVGGGGGVVQAGPGPQPRSHLARTYLWAGRAPGPGGWLSITHLAPALLLDLDLCPIPLPYNAPSHPCTPSGLPRRPTVPHHLAHDSGSLGGLSPGLCLRRHAAMPDAPLPHAAGNGQGQCGPGPRSPGLPANRQPLWRSTYGQWPTGLCFRHPSGGGVTCAPAGAVGQ